MRCWFARHLKVEFLALSHHQRALHKRITATFTHWQAPHRDALETYACEHGGEVVSWAEFERRARPRLLTKMWDALLRTTAHREVE